MSSFEPYRKCAQVVSAALAAALSVIPAGYTQSPIAQAPSRQAPAAVQAASPAAAAPVPAAIPSLTPAVERLGLEQAKERVLANSKLLALAAANVEGKEFATRAMQAQYFPQVVGNVVYFRFNDDLGKVVSTPGRRVTGPRGNPITIIPGAIIEVPVFNQNTSLTTLAAVQPLTALLKVRAGVKAARADEAIAQAQLEQGRRELASGTEQLFWGLLAVQRIRAVTVEALAGAEKLAAIPGAPVPVRLAVVEARQGLQQVDSQLADLQEQMNLMLDLPLCTLLELVEPPIPIIPVRCADEAVSIALANSPDVREAELNVERARAGVSAAKVDWLPNVMIMGGWANQTAANYIQPNIGYAGVMGSYTFVDWGKRRHTVRGAENLVALASLKVRIAQDEVRQKTLKAFRDLEDTQTTIKIAQELATLRAEVVKQAMTPMALHDPEPLIHASKKLSEAQVNVVKAELAYRTAYAAFMALIGDH